MKFAQYVKITMPEGTKTWIEAGTHEPSGEKLADLPEGFWIVFEGENLHADKIRLDSATPKF